jgi:hypothetical protein
MRQQYMLISELEVSPVQSTISIAASDASARTKASADCVCDGVDDQDEFIDAIADLPAVGGRIQLSEGTFKFSAQSEEYTAVLISEKHYIEFVGVGESTYIEAQADIFLFKVSGVNPVDSWYYPDASSGVNFRQIKFGSTHRGTGGGIAYVYGTNHCDVRNCYFYGLAKGLEFAGRHHKHEITDNLFSGNLISIRVLPGNYGICHDFGVSRNRDVGVEQLGALEVPNYFLKVESGCEICEWRIGNNTIEHIYDTTGKSVAIYMTDGSGISDVQIFNNNIEECDVAMQLAGNFVWSDEYHSIFNISGNNIRDVTTGIKISGTGIWHIVGNDFIALSSADVGIHQTLTAGKTVCANNLFAGEFLIANAYVAAAGSFPAIRGDRLVNHSYSRYMAETTGQSTGTGSEQTIAHGLLTAPNRVTITPTATGATVSNVWSDATNVYCTVTNGKGFIWFAGA